MITQMFAVVCCVWMSLSSFCLDMTSWSCVLECYVMAKFGRTHPPIIYWKFPLVQSDLKEREEKHLLQPKEIQCEHIYICWMYDTNVTLAYQLPLLVDFSLQQLKKMGPPTRTGRVWPPSSVPQTDRWNASIWPFLDFSSSFHHKCCR